MKALNSTNCFPFDYSKNNKKKTHFPLEKILQLKFYQKKFRFVFKCLRSQTESQGKG